MLLSFKITNCISILNLDLDFRFAEGKAPNGYMDSEKIFFVGSDKHRAVPCLAFYGKNASGKSNIINAFYHFRNILMGGDIEQSYIPNKLNRKHKSTTFCLSFLVNEHVYEYSVQFNERQIFHEFLNKNGKLLYSVSDKKRVFENLSSKNGERKEFERIFQQSCIDSYRNEKFFRVPFLRRVKEFSPNLNDDILTVYDYMRQNIIICLYNQLDYKVGMNVLTQSTGNLAATIADITAMLDILDVNDITKIALARSATPTIVNNDDNVVRRFDDKIETYHKDIHGNDVKFYLSDESMGTQILFGLLGWILHALKKGYTLLIDELDSSLHPSVFKAIVNLFKTKTYNKNGAQLIFVTHDTCILEGASIRLSEAAFVDNATKKGTTVKRICDVKGISNSDDFKKKYMQHQFGGMPLPRI